MSYMFIALTIILTVYGQLVLKWQVSQHLGAVAVISPKSIALLLVNPWVISALSAAFVAALFWMAAISKLPLSKAYPLMALTFPAVGVLAIWLFGEQAGPSKMLGTGLIVLGVIVLSRGAA